MDSSMHETPSHACCGFGYHELKRNRNKVLAVRLVWPVSHSLHGS